MASTPVAESIVAPVPFTANVSAAPAKAAAASTATGAAPASAATSASGDTTVGTAWMIARVPVSAAALPAALVAVTRAESAPAVVGRLRRVGEPGRTRDDHAVEEPGDGERRRGRASRAPG